jgi:uncharacterized protein YdcH (DUF465 family)
MPSPTDTTAPFLAKGGVSWRHLLTLLGWASPFLIGAAMLYLRQDFATHEEVKDSVAPVVTAPARIQSLEEFRMRQERVAEKYDSKFEAVQTSIATLAAQQHGTDQKVERVLDVLERIDRRNNSEATRK